MKSRRLWYWKPADGAAFLSGVACDGLDDKSKVGKEVDRTHLTEICEINLCTSKAEQSIRSKANHNENPDVSNGSGSSPGDGSGSGDGHGYGYGYGDGHGYGYGDGHG